MFLRRWSRLRRGASNPVKDFILFSARYSSESYAIPPNPCRLAILFLLSSRIFILGCPPKFSIFSILFSVRQNYVRFGTVMGTSYAILLQLSFRTLNDFHPSSTLNALKSLTLLCSAFRLMRLGNVDTMDKTKVTVREIDNRIVRQVNVLKVLELFEEWRKGVQ